MVHVQADKGEIGEIALIIQTVRLYRAREQRAYCTNAIPAIHCVGRWQQFVTQPLIKRFREALVGQQFTRYSPNRSHRTIVGPMNSSLRNDEFGACGCMLK